MNSKSNAEEAPIPTRTVTIEILFYKEGPPVAVITDNDNVTFLHSPETKRFLRAIEEFIQ